MPEKRSLRVVCKASATARPPTPFAHMVINEFLPRAGTDWNQDGQVNVYDEFVELKNLGPINVDLKGWKLDDGQNSTAPYTLPSMTLKPGDRALFYHLATNLSLPDSGSTVRSLQRNWSTGSRHVAGIQPLFWRSHAACGSLNRWTA